MIKVKKKYKVIIMQKVKKRTIVLAVTALLIVIGLGVFLYANRPFSKIEMNAAIQKELEKDETDAK